MGKLIVTENITLDGVIENIDDWFTPAEEDLDAADLNDALRQQMESEAALLLGRMTFEAFRGYWPKQTGDETGVTDHLNRIPKYVVSNSLGDPEWKNTTVLRGDAVEGVRALVNRTEGEVGVTGSITLVHTLIKAGLVDEYRLFVYPVVVGRGRRLFEERADTLGLELIEATPFQSGITLLTYRSREQ